MKDFNGLKIRDFNGSKIKDVSTTYLMIILKIAKNIKKCTGKKLQLETIDRMKHRDILRTLFFLDKVPKPE